MQHGPRCPPAAGEPQDICVARDRKGHLVHPPGCSSPLLRGQHPSQLATLPLQNLQLGNCCNAGQLLEHFAENQSPASTLFPMLQWVTAQSKACLLRSKFSCKCAKDCNHCKAGNACFQSSALLPIIARGEWLPPAFSLGKPFAIPAFLHHENHHEGETEAPWQVPLRGPLNWRGGEGLYPLAMKEVKSSSWIFIQRSVS